MAKQFKLPKPASTATDKELADYASQFDPSGDRRILAEEILRLRKLIDNPEGTGLVVQLQPLVRLPKPAEAKREEIDNALI